MKNENKDYYKNQRISVLVYTLLAVGLSVLIPSIGLFSEKPLVFLLLFITIGGAVVALLYWAAEELRQSVTTRKNYTDALRLMGKIPALVVFKKRKDILELLDDGDGRLTYLHLISCDSDEHIEALHFPVIIDSADGTSIYDDDNQTRVQIESIRVNGQYVPTEGSYTTRERRWKPTDGFWLEYGVIRVPVGLRVGVSECNLEMVFTLKQVFPNMPREYLVIDVPYLTEDIEVEIRTTENQNVGISRNSEHGQPIDAYGEMMDMYDHGESLHQSKKLEITENNSLFWRSNDTKVGYRYKVWFSRQERVRAVG